MYNKGEAFLLLKYYKPNIPSEEYAVYSRVLLGDVLPIIASLKPDYSNFPEGELLTREMFIQERGGLTLVASNESGEIWESGCFGNKFKLATK